MSTVIAAVVAVDMGHGRCSASLHIERLNSCKTIFNSPKTYARIVVITPENRYIWPS
ncbi:hypothetical protein [Leptothoe sp. PORK10 BA2]|uniref:hypothetical protein n=1 Tax=Leptothoe sp. PORK10 BA2 TaxID=3110254 RepID=UPI002B206F8B|nr:hypothetical protein [Leptothoe sp. PORK10 BA2]MEA5465774.1 hypothetical protein [Leptothoe sp. PORK10 BA2]